MIYNTQRDATTVVNPDGSSLPSVSSGELHASKHVQLYSQLQKKLSWGWSFALSTVCKKRCQFDTHGVSVDLSN